MRPFRTDRSLVATLIVSFALAGCGSRDADTAAAQPQDDDVPSATLSRPSVATIAVEEPSASTGVDAIPVVVRLDDRPEGFWAVKSAEIANAAASEGTYAVTSDTATAAPIPEGEPSAAAKPAPAWRTVDAGTLQVPHAVRPGRLVMNHAGGKGAESDPTLEFPYAATHACYLLKVPLTYVAASGFDRPLTRVDVTLVLGDVVDGMAVPSPGAAPTAPAKPAKKRALSGTWQIQEIKDIGFNGLRYGPNPMPGGPEQFYFLSERLLGRLNDTRPMRIGYWSVVANAARSIPGEVDAYALLVVPKKARTGVATIQAKLWYTPGNEATVVMPARTIDISFDPIVEQPVAQGR